MGFLNRFFKKGEDPEGKYVDPLLGTLLWDEDDESWIGENKNFKFLISYEGKSKPSQEILTYAQSTLLNNDWLEGMLTTCKNSAIETYPVKMHEEIKNLKYERICYQGNNMILIQFFENDDQPFWSADIVGKKFRAIGRDT